MVKEANTTMKNTLRWLAVAVLLLLMLFLVPSGAIVAQAEIVEIPLTAKECIAPWPNCYLSDREYEDPSISVKIESGRIYDTNYLVARVKIANATQIRSAMSSSYYNPSTMMGTTIARSVKSVLAINGDYYGSRSNIGLVAKQGKIYRTKCDNPEPKSKRRYDVLIIDDRGDLHILPQATNADIEAFQGTIINGFTFGPGLVINGVRQTGFVDMDNACFKEAQRMCIAQVGELEYLCICSEGPEDKGSKGLTLEQFTDLVTSFEGVQMAYNLDGGSSATMVFKNGNAYYDKINSPNNPKRRPLYDILYFASAYQP